MFSSNSFESLVKKVKNVLKQFVSEYTDYAFNASLVNKLLYYIDEFEFSKEISYKTGLPTKELMN